VIAFLVNQRTRDIGIRMALGETSPVVLKSVAIQGLRPVLAIALLGLAGAARVEAWARASGLAGQLSLFTRTFSDPVLYGELGLVLGIAVMASMIPARRALRVDPVVALRHE
jgi:ABC-type antimicrobial peptide transport system permease subunit